MSLLDPLSHALAAVVAAAHAALTSLGADPRAGSTWLLCIAAVVVAVRLALLPLVAHGVRVAHASARARPRLQALAAKYRDRRDADSVRAMMTERRQISADSGMPRLGCLPLLLQMPVWFALYHLLSSVAAGVPVGAMHSGLVASMSAATLLGVPLASRGYLGAGPAHLAVVAGLAAVAATLAFATQRLAVSTSPVIDGAPEAMAQVQKLMPALSAVGMLVAGSTVVVGLLAYWVCNSAWTLAQTAVITRWFPTPR